MTQWLADWYPDPLGRYELRYWDGAQWTDHVATQGVQALDPLAAAQAEQAAQAARQRASRQEAERSSARPAWSGGGDLLSEPVLVVAPRPQSTDDGIEYAVRDRQGRWLGTVRAPAPRAGKAALPLLGRSEQRQSLQIIDARGEVLIQVTRPSRLRTGRVVVQDGEGHEIGQVVRQSVWGRSRLSLESGGHQHGAVDAEDWARRELTIQDESGDVVARISTGGPAGAAAAADQYVVEIDRPLEEPLRSLVVGVGLAVDTVLKQDIDAFASM